MKDNKDSFGVFGEQHIKHIWNLLSADKPGTALKYIDDVLSHSQILDPRLFRFLAESFSRLSRLEEAIEAQKMALLLSDSPLGDLKKVAELLIFAYRYEEAEAALNEAIRMDPLDSRSHLGLGILFSLISQQDAAISSTRTAISISPKDLRAHCALIGIYRQFNLIDLALMQCEIALALQPCHPEVHTLRAIIRLSCFELSSGWSEYQWRFYATDPVLERLHQDLRPWDGYSTDKPLVVWKEQGIGDEIFHLGFLHQLELLHPTIILDLDPRLHKICERCFPSCSLHDCKESGALSPDFYSLPIASLGMQLGANLEVAQNRRRKYFYATPEKIMMFRESIASNSELIVGISWLSIRRGYTTHKTVPLAEFHALTVSLPVQLVSLQYGDVSGHIDTFNQASKQLPILDPDIDKLNDLDNLLALVEACDLIITISNVTAHLACAAGKECWLLLPWGWSNLWYWHLHGDTSPWYPTARIFRQQEDLDWSKIFATMKVDLSQRCNNGS